MGALDYLGAVTPSTRAIAAEVVAHLNRVGKPLPVYPDMGSQVIWGKGSSSEHATGRALDFMIRNSPSVGDEVAEYVWANRERLGLIHIIWRQRIRSTRTQPGVWRPMSDRGSPTENHMDHPHCYFDGRAVKGKPSTATATTTTEGELSVSDVKKIMAKLDEIDSEQFEVHRDLKGARTDIRKKMGWTDRETLTPATAQAIGWGSRKNPTMTVGGQIMTTLRLSADAAAGVKRTEKELAEIADDIDAMVESQRQGDE